MYLLRKSLSFKRMPILPSFDYLLHNSANRICAVHLSTHNNLKTISTEPDDHQSHPVDSPVDPTSSARAPDIKPLSSEAHQQHAANNKPLSRSSSLIKTLSHLLKCPPHIVQHLMLAQPELAEHPANVESICHYLLSHAVTPKSILDNVHVLSSPLKTVTVKLPLLQVQRPRDINDFVPLLRGSVQRLNKMRKLTAKEADILPGGHRVYYLSGRLNLEPRIVAQHMSTHMFMFDLPVEQLIENLDVQLKYNVAPINILRDPWAFRYSNRSIEMRLDRATVGHKDKLMPWMVRCPETILAKSIQHSVDEKLLLGDRTLVEYIAERLRFDVITTKFIVDKHPQIYTVRATRVKEILDYFLLESEYTANDVAQVPRILCHSLQTTIQRLDELRSLNCKPTSLVVVCKSANEYRKFIETWTNKRDMLIRRNAIDGETKNE